MSGKGLYFAVHGERAPRRAPRRRSGKGPERSPRYRAWIRTLGCAACGSEYDVEAAHTGADGGLRQKASDKSCIPLCTNCHTQAPDSHHRDRAACERRIAERLGYTVVELVQRLVGEWKVGKEEAA